MARMIRFPTDRALNACSRQPGFAKRRLGGEVADTVEAAALDLIGALDPLENEQARGRGYQARNDIDGVWAPAAPEEFLCLQLPSSTLR